MNGVDQVSAWFTPTVLFCFLNLVIGTILIASNRKPDKTHHRDGHDPPPLVRVPSFLDRVKSINLSRYRFDPPEPIQHEFPPAEEHAVIEPEPEPEPEPEAEHVREEPRHVTRSKSDTEPAKIKPAKALKKSASEKLAPPTEMVAEEQRRPATVRAPGGGGDEAVDAKADDFINRFRQQLKLQRLDSILRYKEMLNRGAGR